MLKHILTRLIQRAEARLGVSLDYTHKIAQTDLSLLTRYNRIFGFLDPNKNVPASAYHLARLRGAVAADCGTCVEAEVNLARQAGLDQAMIDAVLCGDYSALAKELVATARLADAVAGQRIDDPEARAIVQAAYGDAGLIEISFAINGAALLPGIKRAMGYATACDLNTARKIRKA